MRESEIRVLSHFCFLALRGYLRRNRQGRFIDYFICFMCKSEIRVLSRFCFFLGPEFGPLEKLCISLTGATFWPAGPSREHFASKGRLAHFRACSKSN